MTLDEHIQQSPIVQAAITEAVHRYYFDNVLKDRKPEDFGKASEALSSLWCQYPNWRKTLIHAGDRYNEADTIAIPLDSKPADTYQIIAKIEAI